MFTSMCKQDFEPSDHFQVGGAHLAGCSGSEAVYCMPSVPNQWLTKMWLWQETTAWRQDTKELHNPTQFITSATDRKSDRCGWNHCLLKTKKYGTAQIPLDVILLQRDYSINSLCVVYLSFSFLLVAFCWVYGLWEGSDR